MTTAIKICGIRDEAALEAAVAHGASHVGFNFYGPSPRCVGFDAARALAQAAEKQVVRVGVFVDPDDATLDAAVAAGLDAIQLVRVMASRRAEVQLRFGLPVWAVMAVEKPGDTVVTGHLDAADFLLWDAQTPEGSALPGGMGHRFDWSLIAGVEPSVPWGLAGGLTPGNVGEAIRVTGAPLVDVASGVESAPGVKDTELIAAFCAAVRSA